MATSYEDIVKLVANNLKCSICLNIFTKPVTLECGHTFCQQCINEYWTLKVKTKCPNCRKDISSAALETNVNMCYIIDGVQWDMLAETVNEEKMGCSGKVDGLYDSLAGGSTVGSDSSGYFDERSCSQMSQDAQFSQTREMSSQEVLEGDPEGSVSMLAYALGTMGPTIVEQQGCSDADDSHRVVFVDLTFCPELGNKRLFFCSEERTVETHPERAARAKGQRRGRFDACQWMAMQELKEGLVYWDVITAHSSGWAAGVAYSSLTHRERLGRTSSSWCLEWSSGQLRAWHNNVSTDVKHSVPSGVRVILDMTKGYLWFQSLDQHQTELHRFHVNFSGPLKPMFWLHGLSENALKFPKP